MNRLRKDINYFIEKMNNDYPIIYLKSLMYELPKLTKKEQKYLLKKINEFNKSNEEIVNKYLQDIDIYEIELVNLKLEHIEIKEYVIQEGDFELSVDENNHHSFYLIDGEGMLGNETIEKDDLIQIKGESVLKLKLQKKSQLFLISTPVEVSYATYSQLQAS